MDTATPNDAFRNPSNNLGPAAKQHVEALLSSVQAAQSAIGEANQFDLTNLSRPFADVQADLRSGGETLESLVKCHIRATVSASLQTHCLTAFAWETAIKKAQDHDQSAEAKNRPLFGLVFSVKDCIHVVGHATTLGCSSRVEIRSKRSAWIVEQLENLGAIMIAKTACPQAMVSNTTVSPLWGMVRSPYGAEYQVGGSSGGEAALVHLHGSMLGIGTDMGGSVRQPAALNELVGWKFKTSDFRFIQPDDFATGTPDTTVPASVCGFLARDIATISIAISALKLYTEPAADAFITGHSFYEASPEVQAAIRYVASGNSKELRLLDDNADQWADAWMDTACGLGFEAGMQMIGSDPVIPTSLFRSPLPTRPLTEAKEDVQRLCQRLEEEVLHNGVNLLVLPGYTYGVPMFNSAFFATTRAEIWLQAINLLDWVALSLNVTVPTKLRQQWQEEAALHNFPRDSHADVTKMWPQIQETVERTLPSGCVPTISIQLVAPPGQESTLMSYARRLSSN